MYASSTARKTRGHIKQVNPRMLPDAKRVLFTTGDVEGVLVGSWENWGSYGNKIAILKENDQN